MTDDPQTIRDAIRRRRDEPELPRRPVRSPSANHPYQSAPTRAPRRRTYPDPTGQQAIGNIKKEKKK